MDSMKIAIYSMEQTLFEGQAEKVIAQTPMGEIAVLNGHLPMISAICAPSVAIITAHGERTTIALVDGILEVRPESEIVILANETE